MKMKDFEERIATLEAEIEQLKAQRNENVQWFEREDRKAAVISDKKLVVPVLKSIIKHADQLKGKKIPPQLWDMARGVDRFGWQLTEKQEAFAFKLINTTNVHNVMDILAA